MGVPYHSWGQNVGVFTPPRGGTVVLYHTALYHWYSATQITRNATIQRFWRYLGRCLRLLTDEQYADVQSHLQSIIWAWNATVCESTGYSPFQVMTGTEPITVASAALQDESAATDLNVPSIIAAASGFALAAAAHSDYMRKQTSESTLTSMEGRCARPRLEIT